MRIGLASSKLLTQILSSIGLGLFLTSISTIAAVPTSASQASDRSSGYTSFFEDKESNLRNSGWSSCTENITWSMDTGGLKPKAAKIELNRMTAAFQKWSNATQIKFSFIGTHAMSYDQATHHLSSPTMPLTNHIAVAVMPASSSPLLRSNVYGFGMPSQVLDSTNRIVSGILVIKEETITANIRHDPQMLDHLYLHELGHVMGLGHVNDETQIMFPTIYRQTVLGSGDLAGAFALTQPCK